MRPQIAAGKRTVYGSCVSANRHQRRRLGRQSESSWHRARWPHSDRRRDQPGQLRRPAGRLARAGHWHQHGRPLRRRCQRPRIRRPDQPRERSRASGAHHRAHHTVVPRYQLRRHRARARPPVRSSREGRDHRWTSGGGVARRTGRASPAGHHCPGERYGDCQWRRSPARVEEPLAGHDGPPGNHPPGWSVDGAGPARGGASVAPAGAAERSRVVIPSGARSAQARIASHSSPPRLSALRSE